MRLEPVRGRGVSDGQRVAVTRNAADHCWTVLSQPGGIVLAQTEAISLFNCRFQTSHADWERELLHDKGKVKAYILGTFQPFGRFGCQTEAIYRVDANGFYTMHSHERIVTARYADMTYDGRLRVEKINEN